MKFLKYFLYVLLALVGVGIILGLTGPKTYQVERSAVISASPQTVWPFISSIKKTYEWSPFAEGDTTMVIEYFGEDGQVGSGSKWSSKMGKGEQTLTTVEPQKSTTVHLKFHMPWGVYESDAYMNLATETEGTNVTWGMKGENDFIGRIFGSVMNMEKNVGPQFEKGLTNLQTLVAAQGSGQPVTYEIIPVEYPGGKYLAVRGDITMDMIAPFYEKNLPAIMAAIEKSEAQMAGAPSGLYYTWDMEKGMTGMAAAIPVTGDIKAPTGMEVITLPAHKSLVINYTGGYNGLGNAHMAFDEHMKNNNLEQVAPVIEEYLTDPGMEPDSNKWVTKITYLIK